MGENSAMVTLIKRSIAFADWAAGEGICPAAWEDADRAERNPDEFLLAYSLETNDEDWDTLADRITAAYEAKCAEIEQLRKALQPFSSGGGQWGAVKAWIVNGAPSSAVGVEAAKKITKAQVLADAALSGGSDA